MSRTKFGLLLAAALGVAVIALAFIAAPHACDGGLALYFWGGIIALAAWVALPFVVPIGATWLARSGWSVALLLLGTVVWLTGLFAANVRIICRLF